MKLRRLRTLLILVLFIWALVAVLSFTVFTDDKWWPKHTLLTQSHSPNNDVDQDNVPCRRSKILCTADKFYVADQALVATGDNRAWHIEEFTKRFLNMSNAAHMPVVTAEVSSVPCHVQGCCTTLLSFRPGTTDMDVFRQVYVQNFFDGVVARLQHMEDVEYILDGGGNVGYSAVLFTMMFPNAKIISVEPDWHNYRMSLINTARFPNIHIVHAGLWSKSTSIQLLASEGEWARMFKEVAGGPNAIPTTTVRALMTKYGFPRLDLAKIDIEGAEAQVFSPTADLSWLDVSKIVVVELHDRYAHYFGRKEVSHEVLAAFAARNFVNYTDDLQINGDQQLKVELATRNNYGGTTPATCNTTSHIDIPVRTCPRPPALSGPSITRNIDETKCTQQTFFEGTQCIEAPPTEAASDPVDVKTAALTVADGVVCLRNVCNERLKFEIEYGLKRGTTDNTYVLLDDEGMAAVLVDVPDNSFANSIVSALREFGHLDCCTTLIVTHLTPKRLESLKAVLTVLLEAGAPVELYLSNPAMQLLRSSFGGDEQSAALLSRITLQVAKPGTTVTLGKTTADTALRLIPTPTPRWPDLLTIYSPKQKMLLSSKLFSAHVSPELAAETSDEITPAEAAVEACDRGGWDLYGRDWRYFFECTLAPVAQQVATALERLDVQVVPAGVVRTLGLESGWLVESFKGLFQGFAATSPASAKPTSDSSGMEVALIAPLHGPVVKYAAQELLRNYGKWTAYQLASTQECGILVLYASAYGNTAALAQAISRGITKAGVGVEQLNLELCTPQEVETALASARGFVIGSPTLGGHMPTQVQTTVGTILAAPDAVNLPTGVFGSFGWSGEAVDMLEQKFKDAGFLFGFEPIRCKFKPTAAVLQVCEESGTDLAQMVLRRKRREEKRSRGPTAGPGPAVIGGTGAQAALGRVVGSLCVVTARDGDAQSAMLASWISQASFDPPGLTIAVKRDRAVEPLLPVGAKFVVNILAEGNDRAVMKHLFKSFKPGEDRFAGLDCTESEVSGCKILKDGAAYLECIMRDKMEAGDHYVLYAAVGDGHVMQQNALAAVHHRKIGTTY